MKTTFSILISLCVGVLVGLLMPDQRVEIKNNYPSDTLSDWETMKLAIIKTESEFNPFAVGTKGDLGLFQITPIYVKEVNRILGEEAYIHEDAFCPEKAMEMFNIMQNHHNPKHDISKAITLHNPTALPQYAIKVRKNMEWVRQYEQLRTISR